MDDSQEERALRRLLQPLEQGIDRALFQMIGGIDDHRPPRAQRGPGVQAMEHRADLVDIDVALARIRPPVVLLLCLVVVGGQGFEDQDVGMVVRLGLGHARFGDEGGGGLDGEARLAQPFPPGQQPGVVHPVPGHGRAPGGPGVFVTDQHQAFPRSSQRSSTAMIRADTACGLPWAGMRAKRSGSAAAKAAKASPTRA
jgi:hypothetical protein